jgi:hypothetical protein
MNNITTKEQLIKEKGVEIRVQRTDDVLMKLRDVGYKWNGGDIIKKDDYKSRHTVHIYEKSITISSRSYDIKAEAFLSWFNPEPKLTTTLELENATEFKSAPLTKREYLLKLVAKMEANKKEFNETVDKQIEKLNKEMCCDGCYIQSDGKYKMHEYKLDQSTAVKVADFINGMESTMEAK